MASATGSFRLAASRVANAALGSSLLLILHERAIDTSEKENCKHEPADDGISSLRPALTRPPTSLLSSSYTTCDPHQQHNSKDADDGISSLQPALTRPPASFLSSSYTTCDPHQQHDSKEDSYPNFTRHGKGSYLKQYLTPQVYQELCHKTTCNGVTLENIIQSGVALPLGSNPPRGLGVYVGDAECYTTFAPLLNPMIAEYHGTSESTESFRIALRRHSTNLDPEMVLSQRPDPTGEYILYTRMRVARSIEGFVFSPSISRCDRRRLDALVQDCVSDWNDGDGKYVPLYEMSNAQHDDLIKRHILFHDPDEWAVYAGLGRDWPDSRGLYCNDWEKTPNIMIWCNGEDHIRVISMRKGGDLHGVFTALSQTVQAMEKSLQKRNQKFVYDERLGYLNTCPTNLGTALRASVFVKLVRLGRQPGFQDLAKRLRLQVNTGYGHTDRRYTGIFDVSNAERLGKSEVELLNIMIQGVGKLIELEKKLERGETVNLSDVQ